MFKLIASDMDGTLLDENGQVPPETYELILALREHGVHFAASSEMCIRDRCNAAASAPFLRQTGTMMITVP